MVAPFAFGLLLFSTLWLAQILMKMIDLFVTKGVAFTSVVKIFVYSLPVVLTTAAPMAVLLGVLITVGRLSSDSELVAMQASGIGFGRIATPLLGFGAAASLAVMALHEFVVPRATHLREKTTLNEVVLVRPLPKIAKDVFFEGGNNRFTMFVRQYDYRQEQMSDVTIFQFPRDGEKSGYPRVTEARIGQLVDQGWNFKSGTTHIFSRDGRLRDDVQFGQWFYPVDNRYADKVDKKDLSPREMTMAQLRDYIAEKEKRGANTKRDWVEYYFKGAFPMASLVLTLVGAPLAIGRGRSGTSLGVGLSVLVMFTYYIIMGVGRTMGENGKLPPMLATWSANLIMGGFGAIMFIRAVRR